MGTRGSLREACLRGALAARLKRWLQRGRRAGDSTDISWTVSATGSVFPRSSLPQSLAGCGQCPRGRGGASHQSRIPSARPPRGGITGRTRMRCLCAGTPLTKLTHVPRLAGLTKGVGWLDWPCGQNTGRNPEGRQRASSARDDGASATEFECKASTLVRGTCAAAGTARARPTARARTAKVVG
jgi:hypothetical protein